MSEKIAAGVPTATIVLDQERQIAFTLGTMRRIREVTGASVEDMEKIADDEGAMLDNMAAYIWAMLVPADRKDLTVEDVEDLLHPGNLEQVKKAFTDLTLDITTGKGAEGNAKAPAKKPAKGRGGRK